MNMARYFTVFATLTPLVLRPAPALGQRQPPSLPTPIIDFPDHDTAASAGMLLPAAVHSTPRGCGVPSSPVLRVAFGAAAGAAAGYVLHYVAFGFWSDEPLDAKSRRARTGLMVGSAAFGAFWMGVVAPRRCSRDSGS